MSEPRHNLDSLGNHIPRGEQPCHACDLLETQATEDLHARLARACEVANRLAVTDLARIGRQLSDLQIELAQLANATGPSVTPPADDTRTPAFSQSGIPCTTCRRRFWSKDAIRLGGMAFCSETCAAAMVAKVGSNVAVHHLGIVAHELIVRERQAIASWLRFQAPKNGLYISVARELAASIERGEHSTVLVTDPSPAARQCDQGCDGVEREGRCRGRCVRALGHEGEHKCAPACPDAEWWASSPAAAT